MGINVIATSTWNGTLPPLSRYFIARLNQLVDEDEIVSNRCPVTNGLILLEELCSVARASLRRWKNGHRLKSQLAECCDKDIGLSLADDPIISKHYGLIVDSVGNLAEQAKDGTNLTQDFARHTYYTCAAFVSAVRPTYTKTILQELLSLDFSIKDVRKRDTESIDGLLRCFVAQRLYEGYSRGFLQIPAKKMARQEYPSAEPEEIVRHLFNFFRGNHNYRIFVEGDIPSFLAYEKTQTTWIGRSQFFKFDEEEDDDFDVVEGASIDEGVEIDDEVANEERLLPESVESAFANAPSEKGATDVPKAPDAVATTDPSTDTDNANHDIGAALGVGPESEALKGFQLQVRGKDQFSAYLNFVKSKYTSWCLKYPDTARSDVDRLWDHAYYYNGRKYAQFDFGGNSDPNVWTSRKNTLLHTFGSLKSFDLRKAPNDLLKELEEPLYFYHQAHSTPFIEGSFIMLWTTLESLASNKTEKADIENIKDLFCCGVAVGAVGRRVNAFVQRLRSTGNANNWYRIRPNAKGTWEFSETGLSNWLAWLTAEYESDSATDPYTVIKDDPLLTKQFLFFNENWKKNDDLVAVIETSKLRMEYMLDRIYATRNRLVHSGSFGSGGVAQWSHLEWYVGKLLSLALSAGLNARNDSEFTMDVRDNLSATLVGHYETSKDYLTRRKNEPIKYNFARHSGIFRFPELCF